MTFNRKTHYEAWYTANQEHIKEYRRANLEKAQASTKLWKSKNPDKVILYREQRNQYLKDRTPAWANTNKIKEIYSHCKRLNEKAGYIKYHIDHKIPLQGKNISGLHVEHNLQILTATKNISKGNKY